MYFGVVQFAHGLGHAPHAFVDVVAGVGEGRADRALERGRFRDDVRRRTGLDLADRDDRRMYGVGLARDERL
jgi:hypothetical protein